MKTTIMKSSHFVLTLAPLSQKIYAGKVKILSDGKKDWAERIGKRVDVTTDFYHIILALSDMLEVGKKQGSFTFSGKDNDETYEVTIKAISQEKSHAQQ